MKAALRTRLQGGRGGLCQPEGGTSREAQEARLGRAQKGSLSWVEPGASVQLPALPQLTCCHDLRLRSGPDGPKV